MALPNLAVSTDLSARGVDVSGTVLVGVMLSVASSLVRQAAGSPVLSTASTVTLWATDDSPWLDLPGKPVTAVSAVTLDGTLVAATDYKLVDGRLWRSTWGYYSEPLEVVVTLTHGFAVVPVDIVQLVCDLAILGMNTATDGAIDPRVIAEKIDDYSVTFGADAASVASALSLPDATRRSLAARFGGGVGVVRSA